MINMCAQNSVETQLRIPDLVRVGWSGKLVLHSEEIVVQAVTYEQLRVKR